MTKKMFNIILQGLLATVLLTVTNLASAWGVPALLSYIPSSPTGIPYKWDVQLSEHSYTQFISYVGAKSWWEPTNPSTTPGWTHSSNWVKLELQKAAYVEIEIEAETGIACTGPTFPCDRTTLVAVGNLYPAISLYKGVDTSSVQDHVFNPVGNGSFFSSSVKYLDSKKSKGKHSLTYKTKLAAGSYTLNIGGANSFYCKPTDVCYKGGQGYEATILTTPVGHH
jgi:hypothetical protein